MGSTATTKNFIRPVQCAICHGQMYYVNHPKHEHEYSVDLDDNRVYVHVRCWREITKKRKSKLAFLVKEIEKELKRRGWRLNDRQSNSWFHRRNKYYCMSFQLAIKEALEDENKKPGKKH